MWIHSSSEFNHGRDENYEYVPRSLCSKLDSGNHFSQCRRIAETDIPNIPMTRHNKNSFLQSPGSQCGGGDKALFLVVFHIPRSLPGIGHPLVPWSPPLDPLIPAGRWRKKERKREHRRLGRRFLGARLEVVYITLSTFIHQYSAIWSHITARGSGKCSLALWPGRKFNEHITVSATFRHCLIWTGVQNFTPHVWLRSPFFFFLLCNRSRCVAREPWIPYCRLEK